MWHHCSSICLVDVGMISGNPGQLSERIGLRNKRWFTLALSLVLAALYALAIVAFSVSPLLVDERFHYAQESFFYFGQWQLVPELTTIPGYHLLLAGFTHLFGTNSIAAVRAVHALLSLSAVAGFYVLRKELWPGTEALATAQFVCLPLLTPLLFIFYTDIPAVSLLIWATWAAVSGSNRTERPMRVGGSIQRVMVAGLGCERGRRTARLSVGFA